MTIAGAVALIFGTMRHACNPRRFYAAQHRRGLTPRYPMLAAGLAVALVASPAGCEPKRGDPQPANQAPAPAADPGPASSPGRIEIKAVYRSETRAAGKIEYTLEAGAAPVSIPAPQMVKSRDGAYTGIWSIGPPVRVGQTVGMTYFGTPSSTYAECVIFYRGQPVSHQQTGRNCAVSYTVAG